MDKDIDMKPKYVMDLFAEQHLLDGVEAYLSGDLKLDSVVDRMEEQYIYLQSGPIDDYMDYYARRSCAQVKILKDRQIVYRRECRCREFEKNKYSCKHVAGILAAYLMKTQGRDVFLDTELEKALIQKTGVATPFEKGILRKTDDTVRYMLGNMASAELPVWQNKKANTAPMGVEYNLTADVGGVLLELKAGEKRKYVVKDLEDFLISYHKGDCSVLGSNSMNVSREFFQKEAIPVLDFLYRLVKDNESINHGANLFRAYSSGQYRRYMFLYGRDLDSFMELIENQPVSVSNNTTKSLIFRRDKKGPGLSVKRLRFGAELSVSPYFVLGRGSKNLYLGEENGLFAVPVEEREYIAEFLVHAAKKEKLFIGEKDVNNFIMQVLPELEELCRVKKEQAELFFFEAENPLLRLYLDAPQQNMISCRPEVYYEKQEKACNLYQKKTKDIQRNAVAESAVARQIAVFFDAFEEATGTMFATCDDSRMYDFLEFTIPRLQSMGEVFISDQLKKLRVKKVNTPDIGIRVEEGSLLVSLSNMGMTKNELATVLSTYDRKKRFYRLKNGSFISFDGTEETGFELLAEIYQNHGLKDPENMKIPLYRAMYLEEQLGKREELRISADDSYERLVHNMGTGDFEEKLPGSLSKVLRGYQKEGFYWLCRLKEAGFGGILADDMGLGKTVQVLSFLLSQREKGRKGAQMRTLIVAPASLIYNWEKELKRYTPELTCRVIAGSLADRVTLLKNYEEWDTDVWITSYDLLKRDLELYEEISFANEIIDEAQNIKNFNTQASKAVRLLKSEFRVALTGTPIENRLSELWSIFDYLMPGFLYGYTRFRGLFEEPIVSHENKEAMEKLRSMVHPFILRRLKREVLKDLPEKIEESVVVRLEGEQKSLYEAHAQRLTEFLNKQNPEEFAQNKLEILAELTKLRQICCSPSMLFENYNGESAKLEACLQLVEEAIAGGHKLLLFSQFTTMLDIIGEKLNERGIEYYRIDGTVSKEKRMELVESFQENDVKVFCISLKAGGTGLNLTAADVVIHFDPWWNVAAQNQATDRVHRIGQKQSVNVYKLIAENTIEERIQLLQEKKAALADELLTGEELQNTLIDKEALLQILSM